MAKPEQTSREIILARSPRPDLVASAVAQALRNNTALRAIVQHRKLAYHRISQQSY